MSRSEVWLGVVLGALVILAGCIPGGLPSRKSDRIGATEPSAGGNRLIATGPRITPRSVAFLDAENVRGSIRLTVDRTMARATVTPQVRWPEGLSNAERKAALDALRPTARVEVEGNRMVLRVRARTEVLPAGAHLDLSVRMPSCGGAIIRNAGGIVELVGVGGEILIVSGGELGEGGDIRIRTDSVVRGPVDISTSDGDVYLFMPGASAGTIELSTAQGDVEFQAIDGRVSASRPEPQRWTGVLNGGQSDIAIRTLRGNVVVRVHDRTWELPGEFSWAEAADRPF
ncbi:MAG: hypothetical protein H6811_00370 [Phycisphaeraceae bacterium]|nr:hypothetical protein [Phycisphaeraceae bacterium]